MNDKLTVIGSKFYQQCEVIMLPTKEQRWNNGHDDRYECYSFVDKKLYSRQSNAYNWSLSHLYILSSEEIKEGDLCLIDNNVGQSKGYQVLQCKKIDIDNGWYYFKDFKTGRCKKIIATTDKYLSIKKPSEQSPNREKFLPRPSDDFIKAFVEKQGKIDKILIEYQRPVHYSGEYFENKLKVSPDNTITIKPIQEEKTSWSRKEVLKALNNPYGQGSINRDEYRQRVLFDLGLN